MWFSRKQQGSRVGPRKKVLLTVSGIIPTDIEPQIEQGLRPRADYIELARRLDADILDYRTARSTTGLLGRILERLGGPNLLLAYACWLRRRHYQAILTDGEQVGLPLAAMLKGTPGPRPRHLMIVHILSVPKKVTIVDWLGLHTHVDRFLTYSRWQQHFIRQRWSLHPDRVLWMPFMVDDVFFAPGRVPATTTGQSQICAVGLERRDYATLMRAVDGLDVQVVIAAASPWSKYKDSTADQTIPPNVTVRKLSQYDLRQLYADSRFLVMPLEPVTFQAGVTAILEAMAMGKAVICSQVPGQTDVIVDGESGRYVPAQDPAALRAAIVQLLSQPDDALRLGCHGRRTIELEMNLDRYADRMAAIVSEAVAEDQLPTVPREVTRPVFDA